MKQYIKRIIKPMLFGMLLGLFLTVPINISAKQANTSTTFYLYDKDYGKYKNQSTLIVKENIKDIYGFYLELPKMNSVTKIVFASNVKTVPEFFFEKFPNVEEIQISKSFTASRYTFNDLSEYKKLKTIKVATGNTKYKVKDNVLYTYSMKTLVVYPKTKKDTVFTMPSTVTTATDAFGANPYLKKITLSKNLIKSDWWFDFDLTKLPNLQTILVASGNKNFKASNGVLYSYNMKTMLIYPTGKKDTTFTVPSTVTNTEHCFGTNKYLKTLTLGKRVSKFIAENWIDEITLPSLTTIKVASGNPYFTTYNGALYTAKYKELVYCARAKVKPYTVKSGTKKIRFGAFANCKITSITLPSGLTDIDTGAFKNTVIKNIVLPSSIKDVGNFAQYMKSLESITVKDGCINYYSKDGILYYKNGNVVAWPAKCFVKELAFTGNSTYINLGDFPNAKSVETIYIGEKVNTIRNFNNGLKKIVLDSENPYFKLYDGVLYDKDYNTIIWYPNKNTNTTVTLHENLKELKQSWFAAANNTEELILPAGLKKIETHYTKLQEQMGLEDGTEAEYDYECDEYNVAFQKSYFQNLKRITIAADNANFTCEDNVVYSKDMSELVWYPVNRENKEYTLPDSVVKLNGQLREFKQLKQLTINNTVKSTIHYLGVYSDSLSAIIAPEDNTAYTSLDGVLYSKNMDTMVVYPNGKENAKYTMPNTVKHARFVWKNTRLQEITLSPELVCIEQYPGLLFTVDDTEIVFPKMFGEFTNLKKVNGLRDDISYDYTRKR